MGENLKDATVTIVMQDYDLDDGARRVTFTGQLLGQATSFRPGKERWFEVAIYKTQGGNYIVAGCGKTILAGEIDKSWVQTCESPGGVVERLHMYDHDKTRYIPTTSRKALDAAIAVDDGLREAFAVQHVE